MHIKLFLVFLRQDQQLLDRIDIRIQEYLVKLDRELLFKKVPDSHP